MHINQNLYPEEERRPFCKTDCCRVILAKGRRPKNYDFYKIDFRS